MSNEPDLLTLEWENTIDDLLELAAEMVNEAKRSVLKHGLDRICSSPVLTNAEKFIILAEEIGEVATAMTYDRGSVEDLYKELLQVHTISGLWLTRLKKQL